MVAAKDFFIHPNQWKSVVDLAKEIPLVADGETILITGANGQIGKLLTPFLKELYGDKVIISDISLENNPEKGEYKLDVTDKHAVTSIIRENNVKVFLNLAAMLSAAAELNPELAEKINEIAPRENAQIAKELGVRLVYNASSIAVQEVGKDVSFVNINTPSETKGKYGVAKAKIEDFYEKISDENFSAVCLRYAGVLAVNIPPSNGTTEEVDKMIAYAALKHVKETYDKHKYFNWGEIGKIEQQYIKDGYVRDGEYCPKIPKETVMPFTSLQTVVAETTRYLHLVNNKSIDTKIATDKIEFDKDNNRIQDPSKRKQRYFISEFSTSLGEAEMFLNKTLKKLNYKAEKFQCNYDYPDSQKTEFAENWGSYVNSLQSQKDWGMQRVNLAEEAYKERFENAVKELEQKLGVAKPKALSK